MSQDITVESEVDDMVLTYDDYITFKEKFDPKKPISLEGVNLEDILREANITGTSRTNYYNAFNTLLKHIHRDGLFIDRDNPEACKYINYILYEEVERKKYRSYDQEAIPLFRKFLDAYGKKRGKQKRCISSIRSIKPQTYNRINALYDVYDKYKECVLFSENTIKHGCEKFENFFSSYDKYMRENESKSLEFNKILENIEQHAKDAHLLYKKGCNKYEDNPRSPRLFKPPPQPKPEIRNQVQKGQTALQSVDNIPQYTSHGITNTLQTEITNDISRSPPEHENQRRDEGNIVNIVHSANDIHPRNSRQETRVPPIREDEEETHMFSGYPKPIRNLYSPETTLYSGRYGHVEEKDISNDVETSQPSVMNTITSALKDVDPVPVVGVSGGMGVLFLLFKYTPVGTFFRGRGYRHRIPSRFDGVYPGFYPGFEGFEEGYFPNNQINIAYGPE
ncbi:hypothetical protein, conserved [Plasmodium vivax]|uniref:VIR protein n=1 Tax=Plasmodium vivax TaxID=5855 RepID=A0A1G4E884_PLAVI|nr:hypothetical protein, conserved [Plasmodium vivax]